VANSPCIVDGGTSRASLLIVTSPSLASIHLSINSVSLRCSDRCGRSKAAARCPWCSGVVAVKHQRYQHQEQRTRIQADVLEVHPHLHSRMSGDVASLPASRTWEIASAGPGPSISHLEDTVECRTHGVRRTRPTRPPSREPCPPLSPLALHRPRRRHVPACRDALPVHTRHSAEHPTDKGPTHLRDPAHPRGPRYELCTRENRSSPLASWACLSLHPQQSAACELICHFTAKTLLCTYHHRTPNRINRKRKYQGYTAPTLSFTSEQALSISRYEHGLQPSDRNKHEQVPGVHHHQSECRRMFVDRNTRRDTPTSTTAQAVLLPSAEDRFAS
jgi:hypothetical protein